MVVCIRGTVVVMVATLVARSWRGVGRVSVTVGPLGGTGLSGVVAAGVTLLLFLLLLGQDGHLWLWIVARP